MEDFKKVKKYSIGEDGDILLSQWASSQTVEMLNGETLQTKAESIDKEISDEIVRAKKAESDLDKNKLDKTTVAKSDALGLVKSGGDITVNEEGTVSVNDNSHNHLVTNISDLTATANELNVLHGVTASTSEINVLDGITSSTEELNKLHDTTVTSADFDKLHDVTANAEELNILDGATVSTEELNSTSGIKGNIQEQLNAKVSAESPSLTGIPLAPTPTADTNTSQIATTEFTHTVISNHNVSTNAHNDIRNLITGLTSKLNALADSDDETLDQMSEIVAYIKANKTLIDSVTTSKINVSDIVNDLTTNVPDKPLSAACGVVIKGLIDALQMEVNAKVSQSDLIAHTSDAAIHITEEERTNWGKAYTNSHSHPNKDVLDGITPELIEKWNKGSGSGSVAGVAAIKGDAETDYRTGEVNITLENIASRNTYTGNVDELLWGKSGYYMVSAESSTGTHPVVSGAYMLEVICPNENLVIQRAHITENSQVRSRVHMNDSWGAWSAGIGEATTTGSGLMSADDKGKLDNLEIGAWVTGIKGGAETDYRKGNVNITLENLIAKNNRIGDDTNSEFRYSGNVDDLRFGKAGCYWVVTTVATGTHPIGNGHYILEVLCPNAGAIIQKAYTFDSSMTYYRMYTNSRWYSWTKGINEATATTSGLMSAADKEKLDSLEIGGSGSSSGGGHIVSNTAPENTNVLWIDTSGATPIMKYYNGENWTPLTAVWG